MQIAIATAMFSVSIAALAMTVAMVARTFYLVCPAP